MATASILVLCRGFRRDTIQRNRHSQMAATVIASQTRLRKVSIGSCQLHSRRAPVLPDPPGEGIRLRSHLVYNGAQSSGKLSIYTGVLVRRGQQ